MNGSSTGQVRLMGAGDEQLLRRLRLAALKDSPEAFLGDLRDEEARPPSSWRRELQMRVWFTAEHAGRPAGLVRVVRHPLTADHYVESMWVAKRARRSGLASALLGAARDRAAQHGRECLRLWVLEENSAAAYAYERRGFVATGLEQEVLGHPGMREREYSLPIRPSPRGGPQVRIRGTTEMVPAVRSVSVTGRKISVTGS